jgi:6-pyruvoyltetrahydropterin/6-carboxytetrahydropterin synthase
MLITKEYIIESTHRLPHHNWKCKNPHGHAYRILVTLKWETQDETENNSESGMITDFWNMKIIKDWLDTSWDHGYLYKRWDEVWEFLKSKWYKAFEFDFSPTAENLARYLYQIVKTNFPNIDSIKVFENTFNSAEYRQDSL